MQFIVPQFIDIEDKVIGPFTFKQFLYLAGGGGLAFFCYKVLPILFAIPLALGFIALGIALTFYKVNGKPFVFIFQAFVNFLFQSKLYIWKQQPQKQDNQEQKTEKTQSATEIIPRLTESKLGDISWSLDILDMKQKEE